MTTKNQTALTRFVKDECANFDKYYQTCLDGEPCKVLADERCGYFEKVVLGPPDYKYKLPGYDYAKLFAQYAELTGAESGPVKQRRCTCGNSLKLRQRFCERCAKDRAKAANRQRQKKHRQNHSGQPQTIRGQLSQVFRSLKHRCGNSKSNCYKYYGGRGIQNKFQSFEEFYDYVVNDLKVDPRGLTIDRIDNDGHYEKGNIRFVTIKENIRNSRICKKPVIVNG